MIGLQGYFFLLFLVVVVGGVLSKSIAQAAWLRILVKLFVRDSNKILWEDINLGLNL